MKIAYCMVFQTWYSPCNSTVLPWYHQQTTRTPC